jgi:DNA-binding PadR family transcriptional regulator
MKLKVAYEMVYDALNHLFWKTGSCLYEEIREKDNGIRRYQVYISLSELEKEGFCENRKCENSNHQEFKLTEDGIKKRIEKDSKEESWFDKLLPQGACRDLEKRL